MSFGLVPSNVPWSFLLIRLSWIEEAGNYKKEDQWSCKRSPNIWAYYKFKNKFRQICCKIGQCQLRVSIYSNYVELEFIMFHAKFHDHRTISSVGNFFEGFYHLWAWVPPWSCDLDLS